MDRSVGSSMAPKKPLVQEGYMEDKSRTATTPKPGLVREVCREWLLLEDGALAHQLQDQEIAAHYGMNRVRNQIVRQDTPKARKEQEEELQQALALQKLQQQLREQQEKDDEEAAKQLAEELDKEEELQRQVRAIRDEQLARRLQTAVVKPKKSSWSREQAESQQENTDHSADQTEPICTAMRSMNLNEPMSEEEARQWQELCDLELARKLQQEEEEESKWRRDVSDLGSKLAIEAQDLELARMLQEKEKARLRKAKEKARQKALQKASQQQQKEHQYQHSQQQQQYDYHQYNENAAESHYRVERPISMTDNIAASIDPTWNRRQTQPQPQPYSTALSIPPHHPVYQLHHHPPHQVREPPRPLPITDLDFPVPVQPIVPGQRRGGLSGSHSQPDSPEPSNRSPQPARSKSGASCSHQ